MKQMLFKAMAILTGLVMSVSLAACGGDDNDEPETPQKKIQKVVVDYSVSLSQEYFDLWDIQITYTNPGGTLQTETIDRDWNLQLNLLTADAIPSRYSLKVVAKPKSTAPTLDPDKIYTLSSECQIKISGQDANGVELKSGGMLKPIVKSAPTNGAHLVDPIKKDRNIFDQSFDFSVE